MIGNLEFSRSRRSSTPTVWKHTPIPASQPMCQNHWTNESAFCGLFLLRLRQPVRSGSVIKGLKNKPEIISILSWADRIRCT